MTLVHDRVGPHGHKVPVDSSTMLDIPEECYGDLLNLQRFAEELNNFRLELGRVQQLVYNLIMACNMSEDNAARTKKSIMDAMGLEVGNWAVDFENKKIARVVDVDGKSPRVVGG